MLCAFKTETETASEGHFEVCQQRSALLQKSIGQQVEPFQWTTQRLTANLALLRRPAIPRDRGRAPRHVSGIAPKICGISRHELAVSLRRRRRVTGCRP